VLQLSPIALSTILAAVNGPTDLADSEHRQFIAPSLLRLRLLTVSGTDVVSVRPWYWQDGQWWPMRFDAAEGVGAVTADGAQNGGKAEGFFATGGLSHEIALVVESGVPASLNLAIVDACEQGR
jgi:hypothetical protein